MYWIIIFHVLIWYICLVLFIYSYYGMLLLTSWPAILIHFAKILFCEIGLVPSRSQPFPSIQNVPNQKAEEMTGQATSWHNPPTYLDLGLPQWEHWVETPPWLGIYYPVYDLTHITWKLGEVPLKRDRRGRRLSCWGALSGPGFRSRVYYCGNTPGGGVVQRDAGVGNILLPPCLSETF